MNDGRTCKEYHNENFGIRGWYRVSLIYDTKRICSEGRYPAGVDICYLEEHERLYEETASQGCVVSEYLPGTKARGYGFPRRNRLIAAMSDELIVIEWYGNDNKSL